MSFIPKSADFPYAGKTLVLPSNSAGNAPMLGSDLYLSSNGFKKVGYFKSKHIALLVGSSIFNEESSEVQLSNEVWGKEDSNLVFLNVRSGIFGGRSRLFFEELKAWIELYDIARVLILTSTHNPVRKLRVSNL